MRRLTIVALLAFAAACSDGRVTGVEPIPTPTLPNRPVVDTSITGSFALSVNAPYSLPITYQWSAANYYAQILTGTLIVSPDGTFARDLLFRRVTNGAQVDSLSQERGTWSRSQTGVITFSSADRGDYTVGYLNGVYAKNEVVLNLQYKR